MKRQWKYKDQNEKNEFITKLLDIRIKNLERTLRDKIFNSLITQNFDFTDEVIDAAYALLVDTQSKKCGHYYWIKRGWNKSIAKVKHNQLVNNKRLLKPKLRISPYSKEFWMVKINEATGKFYTDDEADYKRNSLRPIRPEYWIEKGFSEKDAMQKAADKKASNNKAGANAVKNKTVTEKRQLSRRCKEFWLARDFSEKDAQSKVKEEQTVFSLEKCKLKYGDDEGYKVWKCRQDKWQKTLYSKTPEEIQRINNAKVSSGYIISKAERELYEILKLSFNDIESQFVIKCENSKRKYYAYDIRLGNKIIEYCGTYWHADPRFHTGEDVVHHTKAHDLWIHDKEKHNIAKNSGFEVLVIWEFDYHENKDREIKKCIHFLTM